MRRPVKPFVTEYKGTNRRPGSRGGGDDLFGSTGAGESAPRRTGETGGQTENAYEAAMKAADALFSPAPDRSREPEEASDAPLGEVGEGQASGGRILRAIDEPPPPEPAEIEEAPRRRGRKPGSKNKPKVLVAAVEPLAPDPDENEDPEFEYDGGDVAAAPVPPRASIPYRSRKADRFPWVRTKLKPGEQWKRRLPKVCW